MFGLQETLNAESGWSIKCALKHFKTVVDYE
jgi:hypothetical protein